MANGGFKAFEVTAIGVGSMATTEEKQAACLSVVQQLANGVVGLAQGWSLDYSISPSPDACEFWDTMYGIVSYGAFLVHTSGAKMLIHYNVEGVGLMVDSFLSTCYDSASWDGALCGGLGVTVVPPSKAFTSSEYPIVSDTLKIIANVDKFSNENTAQSFLAVADQSESIKYIMAIRGTQVIVITKPANGTGCFLNIFGDIVQCAHESDNSDYSTYAGVSAGRSYSSSETGWEDGGMVTDSAYAFKPDNERYFAEFYSSQGYVLQGNVDNASVTAPDMCSCASMGTPYRWFALSLHSSTTTVCDADGFKGYINPEVVCMTKLSGVPAGSTLDNGNFLALWGGVIIGWDPSNTVYIY